MSLLFYLFIYLLIPFKVHFSFLYKIYSHTTGDNIRYYSSVQDRIPYYVFQSFLCITHIIYIYAYTYTFFSYLK